MKVVILAGGLGTRISEESHLKPKPMIEVGKYPILVHIMRIYAAQGFNEFIICAGYKQQVIKEYFAHFDLYTNDVTFDIATGVRAVLRAPKFNWKITVADTGLNTQTGGRIKRIEPYINADDIKNVLHCSDLEAAQKATSMREECVAANKSFTFETVLF